MSKNTKQREVVFSRAKKSNSEIRLGTGHRKCKRPNCLGCSNHFDNYLETTRPHNNPSSHQHSTLQKAQKSKSHKKLVNKENSEDRKSKQSVKLKKKTTEANPTHNFSVETQREALAQKKLELVLRQEVQSLNMKLQSKKKKITQLKVKLKACESQLEQSRRREQYINNGELQMQQNKKEQQKHHSEVQRNLMENILSSQALAKQTLDKYRKLEEEFTKFRNEADSKLSRARDQYDTRISRLREQHQVILSKQKLEYESKITKLHEEHQVTIKKMAIAENRQNVVKETNRFRSEQKLVNDLRQEVRLLERTNKELRDELFDKQSEFLNRQRVFKQNLGRITQKVEHWSSEVARIRQIQIENDELKSNYYKLLEKYRLKKLKHRETTIEWGQIFKEFLAQVNRLKKQIDVLTSQNLRLMKNMV